MATAPVMVGFCCSVPFYVSRSWLSVPAPPRLVPSACRAFRRKPWFKRDIKRILVVDVVLLYTSLASRYAHKRSHAGTLYLLLFTAAKVWFEFRSNLTPLKVSLIKKTDFHFPNWLNTQVFQYYPVITTRSTNQISRCMWRKYEIVDFTLIRKCLSHILA